MVFNSQRPRCSTTPPYSEIKSKCDKYVYTSEEYDEQCMMKRNRHLVDYSKFCICYLEKEVGGTAYTVDYAKSRGLKIINIANEI